jgi:hypothetical protein
VALKPEAYDKIIDDVFTKAGDEGFFAANHPKLANSFDELVMDGRPEIQAVVSAANKHAREALHALLKRLRPMEQNQHRRRPARAL